MKEHQSQCDRRVTTASALSLALCVCISSAAWSPRTWPCKSDLDCSLNGVCLTQTQTRTCTCDPGWTGAGCAQLDLAPAAGTATPFGSAEAGLNLLHDGNLTSTWGGSVVFGLDGRYHMFASLIENHCGINSWLQNSVVVHATSSSPNAPFTINGTLAPVFSHEPIAVLAPTGEMVVFYTTTVQMHRTPTICKTCTDCIDGNSTMDCPPDWDARGRNWSVPLPTYMTWTSDPTATTGWSTPIILPSDQLGISPSVDTNFAPVIMTNGSLLGVTRGGSIIFATSWKDTSSYKCVARAHLPDFGEDPSVWIDNHNRFHIITHASGGRHFFSMDGLDWFPSPVGSDTQVFSLSAVFEDGSMANFGRRERPHLIFNPKGIVPMALSTAVTAVPTKAVGQPKQLNRWPDASYTFIQPIRNAK